METKKMDLAAFAIARGSTLADWSRENGRAIFKIKCREPEEDIRLSFFAFNDHNLNMQNFINARHMLLDIVNERTDRR